MTEFSYTDLVLFTENFNHSTNFISEGGFGKVFKGHIPLERRGGGLPEWIVVKVMKDVRTDPERHASAIASFRNERTSLTAFSHENAVRLIGYCGLEYLVFDYIEGETLSTAMLGLKFKHLLKILRELAGAIHQLHTTAGIVHGDLKLDNIMITRDKRPKIIDFGASGRVGEAVETVTYGYFDWNFNKDRREAQIDGLQFGNDVYAFGIIMQLMLRKDAELRPNVRDIFPDSPLSFIDISRYMTTCIVRGMGEMVVHKRFQDHRMRCIKCQQAYKIVPALDSRFELP